MLRIKLEAEVVPTQSRKQLWLEFTGHHASKNRYELMKAMPFSSIYEEIIQLVHPPLKVGPQTNERHADDAPLSA